MRAGLSYIISSTYKSIGELVIRMVTENYHIHLERPDKGRVAIREEGGNLQLVIPTKKSPTRIFTIAFMCAWLGGWAMVKLW